MALTQRQKRYITALTLGVVPNALIGVVLWGRLIRSHQSFPPNLAILLSAAFAGTVFLASIPWWRALDEMQREAQRTSWYWGGCFGCIVGVLSAAFIGGFRSPLLLGALLVSGAQVVSFIVSWVVYWLTHRRVTM